MKRNSQAMEDLGMKMDTEDVEVGEIRADAEGNIPRKNFAICNMPFGPLPVPGKFLNASEILQVLSKPQQILSSVPEGEKQDVFYVIDNMKNMLSRTKKRGIKFVDDCGEWNQDKRTATKTFLTWVNGVLRVVIVKNKKFCTKEGVKTIPLEPQPDKSTLIKIHNYYNYLKDDENYRRRITVVSGRGYSEGIALYEYSGTIVQQDSRNKKKRKRSSSDSTVRKKILEEIKHTPVKDIYNNMLKDNIISSRHLNDLYNMNYVALRRKREELASKVSEEKRKLIKMLAEDSNVQAVIHRKDKHPCVILYNDEQMTDMIRNLECENLIGLDCSHRLGDCYITMTVYQNSRAPHKDTLEPLLFLGPLFIHWDDEFLTYVHFFSHIINKLKNIQPHFEVRLGSEVCVSLFKALKYSFPASECIVNYRHLEETVATELYSACNGRRKECSEVVKKLFGSCGVTNSPSLSDFEGRVSKLAPYVDEFPGFKIYLGQLEQLLYTYVCKPKQKGVVPVLWHNGNDDYVDNLIMFVLRLKPESLIELMERLSSVIKHQIKNIQSI